MYKSRKHVSRIGEEEKNLQIKFRSIKLQEVQNSKEIVCFNIGIQKNPVRTAAAVVGRAGYYKRSHDYNK